MEELVNEPPGPTGVRTFDELGARLRALQAWAGMSYRDIHRWLVRSRRSRDVKELPSYSTVYRTLQPGRSRLDVEIVVDIARVLLGDDTGAAVWRQAYQVAAGQANDAATVSVFGSLPDDYDDFIGRSPELDLLIERVEEGRGATGHTVLISGIEGMAGVGKTRLAVRAAHHLLNLSRFTELQLSVNLRGFDPTRAPADPAAVLAAFLRQLGLPGDQIHRLDLAGRTARYRELLADKDALVLLDNAASEDQVRPLLPDNTGCLVLVTSRLQLGGLPAIQRLPLGVFTPAEALELLRMRLGTERTDAEPDCAARIAEVVGHLPLGLALIASRIQSTPDWSLADHLERLVEHRASLRLDDGVKGALDLSYKSVPPEQQRVLRLLGLHPGRDLDGYAAAALTGSELLTTEQHLEGLCASHLLQQRVIGRYELHDLVRPFAASCGLDEDAPTVRRAALARLFEHYRYGVAHAMDLYAPHETHRRPTFPDPGTPSTKLSDRAAATAWLETERANLIAAAIYAADHEQPAFASDLSTLLHRYLDTTAHHHDAEVLHSCASRVADGADKARALNRLGTMHARLGEYENAIDHYEQALGIFREVGDHANEGRALNNLGLGHYRVGHYAEAREYYEQALVIAHQSGDRVDLCRTMNNLGMVRARLGHDTEATETLLGALTISREVGNRAGESYALTHLATVDIRLGNNTEAAAKLREALAISRDIADRVGESYALTHLGTVSFRLGIDDALSHHERSITIGREDDDRETEAEGLNELGATLRHLGRPQQALERHHDALAVATLVGDQYQHARSHDGIAHAQYDLDDLDAARVHWQQALALFTELGTPEADAVARRLHMLTQ